MFLESTDGPFCGVDAMIVRRDQLDFHLVETDVLFDCLRAFIIHDVWCRLVVPSSKNIEDVCEGGYEGCVGLGRHWVGDDGIEVIDIHNKDVLHILEGPDRESTSEVCVHGTGCSISESSKTKHILDCTVFVGRKHTIYLSMGQDNVCVFVAR